MDHIYFFISPGVNAYASVILSFVSLRLYITCVNQGLFFCVVVFFSSVVVSVLWFSFGL